MFAGLAAARKQAKTFGLVVDEKDIAVADQLGDTLTILWSVVQRAAFAIGAALGPSLIKMGQAIVRGLAAMTKWIDANREFTVDIAKTVTGLGLLGDAFDGILDALSAGD